MGHKNAFLGEKSKRKRSLLFVIMGKMGMTVHRISYEDFKILEHVRISLFERKKIDLSCFECQNGEREFFTLVDVEFFHSNLCDSRL